MADFLLSVGVDVGLSYDQMQKDISDLVTQLNQNPQRVQVGLEIDHSAIERFRTEVANIHNSMGGLGRVTVSPVDTGGLNNAIDGISHLAQSTQGAISTVQTMRAELNSVNAERIQQAIASINGISAEGASALAHSLGEANVRATEVRARLLEAADTEQQLVALQVRGTNEAGHMVNYLMTYNTETGEISRRMVDITARLEDATSAESHRATTIREIADLYRQMHALMRTNTNATNITSYAELANQAQLLQDALALARTESISIDEAFTRLGTSGATAIGGARDAMSAFRLEMEQTGVSGSVSLTSMYDVVTQMTNMLNRNSGHSGLETYTNLKTQADLLSQAINLASKNGITLEEALTKVGLNGTTAINNAKEAMSAFKAEMAGVTSQDEILKLGSDKYQTALKNANTLLQQVRSNTDKWTAAKHGKSSEDYKIYADQANALEILIQRLNTGKMSLSKFNKEYNRIKSVMSTAATKIHKAGEATKTLGDRMRSLVKSFSYWFSATRIVMAIYRTIRQMVSNVIELENAFTQLRIVTGATEKEMEAFSNTATKLAKNLGKSVTDVAKSIEVFSRLGYSLEDASKLAEYANILSNVAAVDTDTATTGLTSIVKGFGFDVSEVEHIADVLISVGQKYAVSAEELMEAFEKSGAALSASNTSFEKSAGLIAAANASVQNASTVGTALKTVSARIRGSKTDLDELGEDTTELAQGFSKYAKELKALTGFDIMVSGTTNEFKDLYDIMDGIAEVWDNLSDTQQARVAEILGGTRQLQVISSIIGNWGDAAGAYETAMNSAGESAKANSLYMETATAHIGKFKAVFQDFSSNLISSGFITSIVDVGTGLLNILNFVAKIIGVLGGLNTVLYVTLGIVATLKAEALLAGISKFLGSLGGIVTVFGKLGAALKNFKTLTIAARNASAGAMTVYGQSTSVLGNLTNALNSAGIAATSAQVAVGAFMAALTVLIIVINLVKNAQEKARQAAEETRQKNIQAAQTAATLTDELSTLINRYIELSDAIGTNKSDTSQLIDTRTELIKKLKLEQDELDTLVEKYGSLSDAIKAATIEELKESARDLRGGVISSTDRLLELEETLPGIEGGKINFGTGITKFNDYGAALQVLRNNGYILSEMIPNVPGSISGRGSYIVDFGFDLSTVDGIITAYDKIGKMLDDLSEAGLANNHIYDTLHSNYIEMSSTVDGYKGSIGDLNSNLAEQHMLNNLIGKETPKTRSEFDAYRDSVVKAAVGSGQFVGSENEIKAAIDAVLAQQPEFMRFYKNVAEGANDATSDLQAFKNSILVSKSDGDKLLTNLINELSNSISAISPEDIATLYSSEDMEALLEAFPGVRAEFERYIKAIEAGEDPLKQQQILLRSLKDEYANVKADQLIDAVDDLNKVLKETPDNTTLVGNALEAIEQVMPGITAGLYDSSGALKAEAAQAIRSAGSTQALLNVVKNFTTSKMRDEIASLEDRMDAASPSLREYLATQLAIKQLEYDNFMNSVNTAIDISVRISTSGGGSSSGSSADEHLEEYKEKVAALEHERNMDRISEAEYYEELEDLANEYLAGRSKYIDEYRSVLEDLHDYRKELWEKERDELIELQEEIAEINKKAKEDYKDSLEEEYKLLKESIQKQKDLISKSKNEKKHDDDVKESDEEIASIREQIMAISLDDSAKAKAKRQELEDQLAEALLERENMMYDWSIDQQENALDEELDRLDAYYNTLYDKIDAEIEAIETGADEVVATLEGLSYGDDLTKVQLSTMHTGGVVSKLKKDEVPAVLQEDEVVLTANQASALQSKMSLFKTVGEKLSSLLFYDTSRMPYASNGLLNSKSSKDIPIRENTATITFAPVYNVGSTDNNSLRDIKDLNSRLMKEFKEEIFKSIINPLIRTGRV